MDEAGEELYHITEPRRFDHGTLLVYRHAVDAQTPIPYNIDTSQELD